LYVPSLLHVVGAHAIDALAKLHDAVFTPSQR
jgi:hypothetical protein